MKNEIQANPELRKTIEHLYYELEKLRIHVSRADKKITELTLQVNRLENK